VVERRGLVRTAVRRELAPGRHGYGLLLVVIIVSIGFQLAANESELTRAITIMLQGGVFLAALWASQARTRLLHLGTAAVLVVTVIAAITFAAEAEVDEVPARVAGLLMLVFAPVAIIGGLQVHFREEGRVTVQTMFGVLCIYLLIGSMFAAIFGIIDAGSPFFAQLEHGTTSDFLYFSFSSLTTTGYGDLTAATDLGRSFAITEQLIGQIYLVTVVAVIVGNLRRGPARSAS
jgi:Ion channel